MKYLNSRDCPAWMNGVNGVAVMVLPGWKYRIDNFRTVRYDGSMRILGLVLFGTLCWGQTTEPITGSVTIPAGLFELPLTFQSPLLRSGNVISCPTCGSGGGGTTSNLLPWQPASQATPPALASWTQVNGGGNGVFSDVRNAVLVNSVSGNSLKAISLSAPTGTFAATAHFSAQCATNDYSGFGMFVGDAGTNMDFWKLTSKNNAALFATEVEHWSSPTAWASSPYFNPTAGVTGDTWLRVKYDGTNLTYWASPTGTDDSTFTQFYGEPLTFTPAKVGIVATSQNTNAACVAILNQWNLTAP